MYTSDSFISITEARKNLSVIIDSLGEKWEKIIFRNNKPTAVLIDFKIYENIKNNDIEISEISWVKWSEDFINTKEHNELLSLMESA